MIPFLITSMNAGDTYYTVCVCARVRAAEFIEPFLEVGRSRTLCGHKENVCKGKIR